MIVLIVVHLYKERVKVVSTAVVRDYGGASLLTVDAWYSSRDMVRITG